MNRKRMSFALALAAVVVLGALGWLLPLSKNSQAAPAPAPDASFKGKLLLVNTREMPVFILEKGQVQKIGDHSWLVGKGAAGGRMSDWCKGRTVRLQMDHIVSITEFDDLKDAKKAVETANGGTTYSSISATTAPIAIPAAPAGAALPVPPPPPPAPPSK